MNEHQIVKNKLEKCEIELKSKEELLENTKCMLAYSENRIVKIEEFVNSQKERISSLEEKLQESEQVSWIFGPFFSSLLLKPGQDWSCWEAENCRTGWHNEKSDGRVAISEPAGEEKIIEGKFSKMKTKLQNII